MNTFTTQISLHERTYESYIKYFKECYLVYGLFQSKPPSYIINNSHITLYDFYPEENATEGSYLPPTIKFVPFYPKKSYIFIQLLRYKLVGVGWLKRESHLIRKREQRPKFILEWSQIFDLDTNPKKCMMISLDIKFSFKFQPNNHLETWCN